MATKTPNSAELAILLLPAPVAAHKDRFSPTPDAAQEVVDASIGWAELIAATWTTSGYTLDNVR
jgi:hypothetical protein